MPPRDESSRVSGANLTRRVIIALDTPDLARAERLMDALGDRPDYYKVGLELFAAEGPAAVLAVRDRGHRVFLDLKLHDIPETVARAARAVARLGVELVTVHAAGGPAMIQAAAAAAQEGADGVGYAPALLGVTILTSLDRADLDAVGLAPGRPVNDVVVDLGRMAVDSGCGGLIAAGSDARALRAAVGPDARIVTPRGATGLGGRAGPETNRDAGGGARRGSRLRGRRPGGDRRPGSGRRLRTTHGVIRQNR